MRLLRLGPIKAADAPAAFVSEVAGASQLGPLLLIISASKALRVESGAAFMAAWSVGGSCEGAKQGGKKRLL